MVGSSRAVRTELYPPNSSASVVLCTPSCDEPASGGFAAQALAQVPSDMQLTLPGGPNLLSVDDNGEKPGEPVPHELSPSEA